MTSEIHQPELENLIHQRMKSGAYQSVEDFLLHALNAPTMRRRSRKPATN